MRSTLLLTTLAITTLALVACTPEQAETDPDPDDGLLAPPEPGKGVQIKMAARIEPGTETEMCTFIKAPPEVMMVQRDEVRYSPGSHHVLVYETDREEIPRSDVFDCKEVIDSGVILTKLVAGSQNADGASMLRFPENVAMPVRAGAVLLMNAHYINASSEVMEPEIRVNLHTIPASQVEHEGDVLYFYNLFIGVPAQSEERARMRCPVRSDITLVNFQSHMHRLGVGYAASVVGEQPFYENTAWEGVPVLDLGEGKSIKAGSVIDYHCDYKNPTSEDVFQGNLSTDEMCMAVGSYYPADPTTAKCSIPGEDPMFTANIGADWIGDGTSACAETMGCVQAAFDKEKVFQEVTKCVHSSAPEDSEVVSDMLRCLFTHASPLKDCQAELAACPAD